MTKGQLTQQARAMKPPLSHLTRRIMNEIFRRQLEGYDSVLLSSGASEPLDDPYFALNRDQHVPPEGTTMRPTWLRCHWSDPPSRKKKTENGPSSWSSISKKVSSTRLLRERRQWGLLCYLTPLWMMNARNQTNRDRTLRFVWAFRTTGK